jgi:hypothetical protein
VTQQINLYDDRLRPRHELAKARSLGLAAAVLLALLSALGVYARLAADRRGAELSALQSELRTEQERVTALTKAAAERRVAPALAGELANSRALLETRQEVMDVLASGQLGKADGFSGVMFGFARQAQSDVWLTGFSVAGGGEEIEIRGRLLDPAKLPGYVQRLSGEPVFHGRRFAALDMRSVEPEAAKADAGAAVPPTSATLPRYVEFVLRSANAPKEADSTAGAKP